MTFIPRVPLAAAEQHVDFAGHNDHIIDRRARLEQACAPAAKRIAVLATDVHGPAPLAAIDALSDRLRMGLARTARFGFTSAVSEIDALRAHNTQVVTAGWSLNDAGRYALIATEGIDAVLRLVARRAAETARAVADAAAAAVRDAQIIGDDTAALAKALTASSRSLHNHVLELVGETLNLGRTAGAMSLDRVPEFALRSEQLDTNTCAPCDELHGSIVKVGTPEYFAILPPTGCLGGGRCRGLMIFGDGPRDVRVPDLLAA